MEVPGVTDVPQILPNFGEIYFDSAMGGRGLDFLADAGSDTVINMVDDNNVTVATTTVETPRCFSKSHTSASQFAGSDRFLIVNEEISSHTTTLIFNGSGVEGEGEHAGGRLAHDRVDRRSRRRRWKPFGAV